MTLLATVQQFCLRTGIPKPASVVGSTDTRVLQIQALLEEIGNDLAARGGWQGITFEANLSTLAAEDQGAIATIASNGFRYIKNQTLWDRTSRLPICGPLDAEQWQASKALVVNGPRYRYRIRGGKLLVNPNPPASDAWYFEYVSQYWILGADGTTYKQYFTLDTDTLLLPDTLMLMGLRWAWKKEKGMDYAQDFDTYERQVKDAIGRDGGKPILCADGEGWNGPVPGVWVPSGSWPL